MNVAHVVPYHVLSFALPSPASPLLPSTCLHTHHRRVFNLLAQLGLGDEPITMRMTGCPNGCARPYMAEIGFVGDGPNSYQVGRGRTGCVSGGRGGDGG